MSDEVKNTVYIQCGIVMGHQIIEALKKNELFTNFIPTPDELKNRDSIHDDMLVTASMKQKYGFADWKEFQLAKWGTKWEAEDVGYADYRNGLKIWFTTANNPPIAFYQELAKLVKNLQAYYFCDDAEFAGSWEDGKEKVFDFLGLPIKQIKANVPIGLIKEFDIITAIKCSR